MANRKRDGEPLATLMRTQVGLKADHFGQTPPSVSVPQELSLKQFRLGEDENNYKIDSGILPFMVTPPGATSEEAAFCRVEEDNAMIDYGVVAEGATGLSLDDAWAIRKGRAYIPLNWDIKGRTSCGLSWPSLLPSMVVTITSLPSFMLHSSCLSDINHPSRRALLHCGDVALIL